MSEIIIQEIQHPKFRKKETRVLQKRFLQVYRTEKTDDADKLMLNALKLKLILNLPIHVFLEFFAYNPVGWTTNYLFEELNNPQFQEPQVWVSKELDSEIVSGSGQKVGEVGNALVSTVNLMCKSSFDVLSPEVKPINILPIASLCLVKEFRLHISLGALVFLYQHRDRYSHSLKKLIEDILDQFDTYCKTAKYLKLV
jgi:hypothetical protein